MNCCDDNGKCTGGHGCAARKPEGAQVLRLAPGVIEGHKVGLLGTPAQRRELKRWLLPSLAFSAVVTLCGLAVGVIAGRFFP
ncbi:MAG: hypothetical protein A3I16_09875 [Burkholderiales bacterium RIFCSPLOWO2_02_FULL_66_35]|nr:MAG: hypothetical protein A3I16_09875 [Burkholderiales bacterium RIFCSPLOWO2_02_FULL_66_35]